MSFEEEFDRIIRRKAEQEQYPFDERNWEKTSMLLDAERKAERIAKWKRLYLPVAVSVLLVSSGIVAVGYLNTDNNTNTTQHLAAKINSSSHPAITVPNTTNTEHANEHHAKNPTAVNVRPENASATTSPVTLEKAVISPLAAKNKPGSQPALNAVAEVPAMKENDASAETDNNTLNTTSVNEENNTNTNPVSADEMPLAQNNERENTAVPENVSPVPQTITTAGSEALPNTTEQALETEQLSAVYSRLPFEVSDPELQSTPFIFLTRYDDDYYKPGKIAKSHYLDAELGANYLFGWDTKQGKDGAGFNWFGGFNYGRYLTQKISASIGLQAYSISHIEKPFYLVSGKEYGFGSTDIYTRVITNQLYYVAVPLKFNYKFNSSNTIGFGVNAAYLVSAENTVSTYYVLDNEEKTLTASAKDRGIFEGTRMTNVLLSAHYKTQLADRVALNAEFNYGLTDIFKNMGSIKNTEAPMGIRLSLQYTLFDK